MIGDHKVGRPRSADSILMAIKALILEYIRKPAFKDPTVQEFVHKLLLCFGHGTKFALGIYIEKSVEVDRIIRLAGEVKEEKLKR